MCLFLLFVFISFSLTLSLSDTHIQAPPMWDIVHDPGWNRISWWLCGSTGLQVFLPQPFFCRLKPVKLHWMVIRNRNNANIGIYRSITIDNSAAKCLYRCTIKPSIYYLYPLILARSQRVWCLSLAHWPPMVANGQEAEYTLGGSPVQTAMHAHTRTKEQFGGTD